MNRLLLEGLAGAGALALVIVGSLAGATAQGPTPIPSVWLQNLSPGTAQTGNLNIDGTAIAGAFQGNGSLLTSVNADLLDGLNSTAFQYVAGAPLQLSGNMFSVTNLGITASLLADGSVTSVKVALPLSLSTLANGAAVLGVTNTSNVAGSSGIFGAETGAVGVTYGLHGRASSNGGRGVFAESTATNGTTYGVYATTASNDGRSVFGENTALSGVPYGIHGKVAAPSGRGVYAQNTNTIAGLGVYSEVAGSLATAVYGTASNSSGTNFGVQGWAYGSSGTGVYGRSPFVGVEGDGGSATSKGVYGHSDAISGTNYGVFGHTASPAGYGVYSSGNMHIVGDFTATGSKTGYVADIVLNAGNEPLEPGDVVEIVGHQPAIVGDIPVIVVRKSQSANSRAVLGPVDCALLLTPTELGEVNSARPRYETPQFHVHKSEGSIKPGAYGRVVTLGSFKTIKVDATFGAIHPGDLLVTSASPGYAMRSDDAKIGTVIGKALGNLGDGIGEIPVMVTSR